MVMGEEYKLVTALTVGGLPKLSPMAQYMFALVLAVVGVTRYVPLTAPDAGVAVTVAAWKVTWVELVLLSWPLPTG
jgi:hypothetical protein